MTLLQKSSFAIKYSKIFRDFSVLSLCLLFSQLIVHHVFDLGFFMVVRGDSFFYIENSLQFPHLNDWAQSYQGYIFLLWLSNTLFSSFVPVIFFQICVCLVSSYLLKRICEMIGGQGLSCWLAPMLFIFNPSSTQWLRYLLTESLFFSTSLILLFLSVRFPNRPQYSLLCSLVLFSLRPNGFLFFVSVLLIILISFKSRRNIFWSALFFLVLFFLVFLKLPRFKIAGDTIPDLNLLTIFQKGEVIYGSDISFKMPLLEVTASNSLKDFFLYMIHHPYESLLLGFSRILSELILVRPWYSFSLNICLIATSFFILVFSFFGLSISSLKSYRLNLMVLILPQVLLIAMTWSIWESRFGQLILNLLLPSSALGFFKLVIFSKRVFSKKV